MADVLKPRWGQPATGIISNIVFFLVAWFTWYIFSDPRGPVGSFPYPFVMYLAMMILVGLWQHMFFGDWPFQDLSPPVRGVVQTIMNLIIVWFMIHVVFYRVLGLGFNFLSQSGMEAVLAAGPIKGKASLDLAAFVDAEPQICRTGHCYICSHRVLLIPFRYHSFWEMARAPERSHSAPGRLCGTRMGLAVDSFLLHGPHCAFLGSGVGIKLRNGKRPGPPMVEQFCGHRSRTLGIRLVGMDDHSFVHDP